LQQIERQYTQVEAELQVAARIQKELLPSTLPQVPGVELAAFQQSSRAVGGDYYDAFCADDESLALAVADGAGKAIAGALLMTQTRSLLRAHLRGGSQVKAAVSAINQTMVESTHAESFVTLFLARLDRTSTVLTYCSAGHLPALLVRDGQVTRLQEGGLPIAVSETAKYTEGRTRLAPGDVLFLFTDGLTEAFDTSEEVYGYKRLEAELKSSSGQQANQVVERVVQAVRDHCAGKAFADDLTVLCMTIT